MIAPPFSQYRYRYLRDRKLDKAIYLWFQDYDFEDMAAIYYQEAEKYHQRLLESKV